MVAADAVLSGGDADPAALLPGPGRAAALVALDRLTAGELSALFAANRSLGADLAAAFPVRGRVRSAFEDFAYRRFGSVDGVVAGRVRGDGMPAEAVGLGLADPVLAGLDLEGEPSAHQLPAAKTFPVTAEQWGELIKPPLASGRLGRIQALRLLRGLAARAQVRQAPAAYAELLADLREQVRLAQQTDELYETDDATDDETGDPVLSQFGTVLDQLAQADGPERPTGDGASLRSLSRTASSDDRPPAATQVSSENTAAAEGLARELGRRRGSGQPYYGLAGGGPLDAAVLTPPGSATALSFLTEPADDDRPGDGLPDSLPLGPLGGQRGEVPSAQQEPVEEDAEAPGSGVAAQAAEAAEAARAAEATEREAAVKAARAAEAAEREAAAKAAEATGTVEAATPAEAPEAAKAAETAEKTAEAAKEVAAAEATEAAKAAEAARAATNEANARAAESAAADKADGAARAAKAAETARQVAAAEAVEAVKTAGAAEEAKKEAAAKAAEAAQAAPLSTTVAEFGTRRDGAQAIAHITPIPADTVVWLQDQLIAAVEGGRGEDREFRASLRTWLTPERLLDEWTRLRSTSGLPVGAAYRGRRYPAALRLTLTAIGPGDPEMDLMPAGPPVQIQRYKFGATALGNSMTSGNLRSLALGFTREWPSSTGPLRSASLTPRATATYGQFSTQVTATHVDQSQQQIRSKGSSRVFNYVMHWEVRPGDPTKDLFAGKLPDDNWTALTPPTSPSAPLRIWFPPYNATDAPLPVQDPADPSTVPAPMEMLRHTVPHFGVVTLPNHDMLLADVARSFPLLSELSDDSREDVRKFLSEGDVSSNIPNAWNGHVPSPTLYGKAGNIVGYLRYRVDVTDAEGSHGNRITGPTTDNLVLDASVVRAHGVSGSAKVTDSLGVQVQATASLGPDTTSAVRKGGGPALQAGYQHSFSHTLSYGGSARESRDLRSNMPLFDVTPDVTFHFDLVRRVGAPLQPAAGSPLAGLKRYPVKMLVMSLAAALGEQPSTARYLPPELLHLRRIPLSTTPLEVSGAEQVFNQAERQLRTRGFLPPSESDWASAALMTRAANEERLNNQRKFDGFRSQLGMRGGLDEAVQDGNSVWFQIGTDRLRLQLNITRRYQGGAAGPNEGVVLEKESKLVMLNYIGTTLPGDEQFSSTPYGLSGAFGGQGTDLAGDSTTKLLQNVTGEVVGATQRSSITDSSAGTQHEDYLLSPYAEGSQHVAIPARFTLTFSDDSVASASAGETFQAGGTVRLSVPTYRMLTEPSDAPPPDTQIRAIVDDDAAALAAPASGLYDGRILRLPQSALIDDVAGSAGLIKAVHDTLNRRGQAPASPQAAGSSDASARVPGAWPLTEPAVQPAASPSAQAQPSAPLASGLMNAVLSVGQLVSLPGPVIAPASMASEVITTALSPAYLKAHGHRQARDSMLIEGAATYGGAADKTFTIRIRSYVKDAEPLPRPSKLYAERWTASTNGAGSISTTQRSVGGSGYAEGDLNGFQPEIGSALGAVNTDTVAVGDATLAFRVITEDFGDAYRFRGTMVHVAEITQSWRNAVMDLLSPGHSTDTVVVEVPHGLEFTLYTNDFHAHPELLNLLPADQRPGPAPAADQPLPRWFVDSGGSIGFGVVSEVEFEGGRGAFEDRLVELIEQAAASSARPGDGPRARVNQLATGQGPAAIIGAGPTSRTAFHWVDLAVTGHRLVEVAVTASPSPDADLGQLRGRPVTKSASVENVLGHITGGSELDEPAASLVSASQARSRQSFAALFGTDSGFSNGPSLNESRTYSTGPELISTHEKRTWLRSADNTNEYAVPYRYSIVVTVRPLTESAVGWLTGHLGAALQWAGTATGLVGRLRSLGFNTDVSVVMAGAVRADALLRFTNSETPKPGHVLPPAVTPHLLHADPAKTPPPAPEGAISINMEQLPQELSARLNGPQWRPARAVQLYFFGAVPLLRQAILDVNPGLSTDQTLRLTESTEAMSIIARDWIISGNPVPLTGAAMTHILGIAGIPGTTVTFRLYDARPEASSKDVSIDDIRISAGAFVSLGSRVNAPSLTFIGSQPLTGSDAWFSREPSVPVLGFSQTRGQIAQQSSVRREMLRIGTPAENQAGQGLTGHLVQAVGVVEVSGPAGDTRWIIGEVLLRTTETPPGAAPAFPESEEAEDHSQLRSTAEEEPQSVTEEAGKEQQQGDPADEKTADEKTADEEPKTEPKESMSSTAEHVEQQGSARQHYERPEVVSPPASASPPASVNPSVSLNLDDVPLGLSGMRTPSPPVPAAARPMPSIGQVLSGDAGPSERSAVASIPQRRRLTVRPVLTEHGFDLASLVAENAGTTDVGKLSSALTDRIKQTVGARALGRALLKLEAGSTDLTIVGLEVAQSVARRLNHRIVFVPAPDEPPVNICP